MTRVEAIETLIREGQKERLTKIGRRRAEQACRTLQLTDEETKIVMGILDYEMLDRIMEPNYVR